MKRIPVRVRTRANFFGVFSFISPLECPAVFGTTLRMSLCPTEQQKRLTLSFQLPSVLKNGSVPDRWHRIAPQLRSLLRIVAAILFMQFGMMKLFGWPVAMPQKVGSIQLLSEIGIAGILEVFGGALLLVGLFTRPIAFILSGEMAIAYFQGHAPRGFWTVANGGSPAVFFCFLWLYLSAAGAGPWSLDAWIQNKRAQRGKSAQPILSDPGH